MLEYLLVIDLEISQFLSSIIPHSSFFDAIFRFLSAEGAYILIWPVVVCLAFLYEFLEHKNRKKFITRIFRVSIVLLFTSSVAFASVHFVLKPILKRQRPNIVIKSYTDFKGTQLIPSDYYSNNIEIEDQGSTFTISPYPTPLNIIPRAEFMEPAPYCPSDYSFPSGHAAIAWAGAYILVKFDSKKRRELVYCLIATFVSFSRIYLSCHYLGDVLAGAIYGLVVGAVVFATYRKIFLVDK